MSIYEENNRRIIKNSIMLYIRMFVILIVSLFTSRITLNALGIVDFGIFNVVAGVVSLMTILNTSMSGTIQRFLNYAQGTADIELQKKTFSAGILVYLVLVVIFVLLAETLGVWFLNHKLVIPEDRLPAARIIYQLVIISVGINFLSNPYNAIILSREKMNLFAYVSILEAVLKLSAALLLLILPYDKLVVYGILVLIISIIITSIYRFYCKAHFQEAQINWRIDQHTLKEIFSFSGWTILGAGSDLIREQGINILLNMFFSPIVNAARGIANQVNGVVTQFFNSFYSAVKPQIVKYYAQDDQAHLFETLIRSSKFSYYLILLVSLPLVLETPFIIHLWLGQIPEYVVSFFRITVIMSAIGALSSPIMTAANATGRIVLYQIVLSTLKLCAIPFSYLFLKMGYSPVSAFIVLLVISVICFFVRLVLLKRIIPAFPILRFLKEAILNSVVVTGIAAIIPLTLHIAIADSSWRSILIIFFSITLSLATILFVGMKNNERQFIFEKIKLKLSK